MMWRRCVNVLAFLSLLLTPVIVRAGYVKVNFDVNHVEKCVYEVIVPKPPEGGTRYERPLPMDLLPFQVRKDKYYPVGTAFAISSTELVTASHVLNVFFSSHFSGVFVRDGKGRVFPIDKIIKFSSRRDFVVFTVKGERSPEYLNINRNAKIGETVFAVGNALGQGVAVRDGIYTSETPEAIDGKWNWIRFSAAASPGNSGGPLLDETGKVIGVVLRKSPNENLNYALPISEVEKNYGNTAEIFDQVTASLGVFDFVETERLNTKINLPLSYNDFKKACIAKMKEFDSKARKDLMSKNKANIFPNGNGSHRMMYTNSSASFPQLISRDENGNWVPKHPQNIRKVNLDNNGEVSYGVISQTLYIKCVKPDNISLKKMLSDSKAFMDMMLRAIYISRTVGRERVRIISLGNADSEYAYDDIYGREWLVKTWPISYMDGEIVAFILPLPDGCAVMLKIGRSGMVLTDGLGDLKVLANFLNVSYNGTINQWHKFLNIKNILPIQLSKIHVESNGNSISYKSPHLQFRCNDKLMKISGNSVLYVSLGYQMHNKAVVLDIRKVIVKEGRFEKTGFTIARLAKPDESDGKLYDLWKRAADGRQPFDKQILIKNDATEISTVYKKPGSAAPAGTVLYDVSYLRSGVVGQREMKSCLDKFMKDIVLSRD